MHQTPLTIPGAVLIHLDTYEDNRGSFSVIWERNSYSEIASGWEQDNVSISKKGVIRGLHAQHLRPQGKLVSVLNGAVYDVILDIRPESPTFGKWEFVFLKPGYQLWVPRGCAHGFQALEDGTIFSYKVDNAYDPKSEYTILWNDVSLGIQWPLRDEALVSEKDALGLAWSKVRDILTRRH